MSVFEGSAWTSFPCKSQFYYIDYVESRSSWCPSFPFRICLDRSRISLIWTNQHLVSALWTSKKPTILSAKSVKFEKIQRWRLSVYFSQSYDISIVVINLFCLRLLNVEAENTEFMQIKSWFLNDQIQSSVIKTKFARWWLST